MIFEEFVLFFAERRKRKPEGFFRVVAAFNPRQTVFQARFEFDKIRESYGSPAVRAFRVIEGFLILDASAQNGSRNLDLRFFLELANRRIFQGRVRREKSARQREQAFSRLKP